VGVTVGVAEGGPLDAVDGVGVPVGEADGGGVPVGEADGLGVLVAVTAGFALAAGVGVGLAEGALGAIAPSFFAAFGAVALLAPEVAAPAIPALGAITEWLDGAPGGPMGGVSGCGSKQPPITSGSTVASQWIRYSFTAMASGYVARWGTAATRDARAKPSVWTWPIAGGFP
jgi:hypothetical protein